MSSISSVKEQLGLITRTAFYDTSNAELIVFDAVVKETHTYSATVPQHPIEDGSTQGDHKIFAPISLSLSIVQSGNPIDIFTLGSAARMAGGLVGGLVQDPTLQGTYSETSSQGKAIGSFIAETTADAYENLEVVTDAEGFQTIKRNNRPDLDALIVLNKAWKNSTFLLVVTPLMAYSNMQIVSITVNKDSKSTNSLIADISLQELPIASSSTVRVETAVTQKVNDGKKPVTDGGFHPSTDPILQNLENNTGEQVTQKVKNQSILNALSGG